MLVRYGSATQHLLIRSDNTVLGKRRSVTILRISFCITKFICVCMNNQPRRQYCEVCCVITMLNYLRIEKDAC